MHGGLRERKQARLRDHIVDSAYDLFAERDFATVSVTDIAERADVGRTTFFRHFGDKQEVLFADEQRLLERIADTAATAQAPPSASVTAALTQLEPLVVDLCTIVTADAARYRQHEQLVERTPELQDRQRRKQDGLVTALEQVLVERGTARPVATVAAHVAGGCYLAARRLAGDDPEALVGATRTVFALLAAGAA